MIGDELIEEVVLGLVIVVALQFGIDTLAVKVVHDVFWRDVFRRLPDGILPELIGLGEERKAIVAVLGRIEHLFGTTLVVNILLWNLAPALIRRLVSLIAIL